MADQTGMPAMRILTPEDDFFDYYISNTYQIPRDALKDGAIYYSEGMKASEIAVFLSSGYSGIEKTEEALSKYIAKRAGDFTGYAPKEAEIAGNGLVVSLGDYVALLICEDSGDAKAEFLKCFGDGAPAPPQKIKEGARAPGQTGKKEDRSDDAYDPESILAAWEGGGVVALSDKNRSIFEACAAVIGELIFEGMDDYEKELAIHDWIIEWADYDKEASDNGPFARPDPDNDNPYGLLVNKKAICTGYSSTFQLFMDLLGIECITVNGSSGDSYSEHSWNMVKIGGQWYCVDVTWNDPIGVGQNDSRMHEYFNVTSEFMRQTAHHWDKSTVPEAAAGKLYNSNS
jgi:hypothetical protein